jgi:hypothetical protein
MCRTFESLLSPSRARPEWASTRTAYREANASHSASICSSRAAVLALAR